MNNDNKLNNTVEKMLKSGKTFREVIEKMQVEGYTKDEVCNAIKDFDKKYVNHQQNLIYD